MSTHSPRRRSLEERINDSELFEQVAVSIPGWGRIGSARYEMGRTIVRLYARHRENFELIRCDFERIYPGYELQPPADPEELRAYRAAYLRRYGRTNR